MNTYSAYLNKRLNAYRVDTAEAYFLVEAMSEADARAKAEAWMWEDEPPITSVTGPFLVPRRKVAITA